MDAARELRMTPVSYTTIPDTETTGAARMEDRVASDDGESWDIARRHVHARRRALALPTYPGALPPSLDAGYDIQDKAIALWHSAIAGWKVGRIPDAWQARLGEERLVGPVFADAVQRADAGMPARFAVIDGGFAAVEAEYVFVLGSDAPPRQREWTCAQALAQVSALHVGVELAGSPLPQINVLGPPVVVSDFGNNAGLILGPEVPDWRAMLGERESTLRCAVEIDGVVVGEGRASDIAGGLAESLRFALARCARRGMPPRAGMVVSTGAVTGIHDILAGQSARVRFDGIGAIDVAAVAATAIATPGETV